MTGWMCSMEEKAVYNACDAGALRTTVREYFDWRQLVMPNADEALLFLVSEVGELADAHVHDKRAWVRNSEKERSRADEIGDILMMLTVYCLQSGFDPYECLISKMEKKGFMP